MKAVVALTAVCQLPAMISSDDTESDSAVGNSNGVSNTGEDNGL